MDYYDPDGNPISLDEWSVRWERERHVASTDVGEWWVSTVWLGLNHNFIGHGPPLIYETMTFHHGKSENCWRWPNRHAALAGHDQAVAELRERVKA